ncbi:MAG: polysaccharide deacetylase family protein, partial [Elusimicrobiaceae bacterium]|nr:polysaccharide deacetylase family protein [Elusimicrobiaceae bacterium]
MEGNAKDLILALEGLEREKNIKRDDILKTIEDALVSALRKNLGKTAQISAKIDILTGSIQAFQTLNVVDFVTNPETEIDVEAAKAHLKNPKAGDVVTLTQDVEDFSRIAAQIAKQVLIQKVRGIERENFYKEFKPREGEVITGSVRRFSDRDLIVDLGKVEAILPYCEQIKKERYTNGSRVKAVIAKVLNQNDLANIGDDPVLSRYKSAAHSGRVGKDRMLEVYGDFEVASHCDLHEDARTTDPQAFLKSAVTSRKFLEDFFQKECRGFAWPYGAYTDETVKLLNEAGFAYGRTTENTDDVTA